MPQRNTQAKTKGKEETQGKELCGKVVRGLRETLPRSEGPARDCRAQAWNRTAAKQKAECPLSSTVTLQVLGRATCSPPKLLFLFKGSKSLPAGKNSRAQHQAQQMDMQQGVARPTAQVSLGFPLRKAWDNGTWECYAQTSCPLYVQVESSV